MFQHMESRTKKELLKGAVQSSVSNLLCYDRKNDEELTDEDVRKLLDSGDVTIEEMVKWFYDELWDQTD